MRNSLPVSFYPNHYIILELINFIILKRMRGASCDVISLENIRVVKLNERKESSF
jgi:hypothetical protein